MNKPICKDIFILGRKSTPAGREDLDTARDLMETLYAHIDHCAGMAANMIGVNKRIIAIAIGPMVIPMLNPVILSKSGAYETEEGCLSLSGVRKTTRYQAIEVEYQDTSFKKHRQTYEGFAARIIQHEYDHLEGHVFTDRISPIRRQFVKTKLTNIAKGNVMARYRTKR